MTDVPHETHPNIEHNIDFGRVAKQVGMTALGLLSAVTGNPGVAIGPMDSDDRTLEHVANQYAQYHAERRAEMWQGFLRLIGRAPKTETTTHS